MAKGKIISHISGGLGNQMFMYAAARALSLRTNSNLLIDSKTGFVYDSYNRSFELFNFDIKCKFTNKLESFDYFGSGYVKLISNKLNRHLPLFNVMMINENSNDFNKDLVDSHLSSCYLRGYWQTEKYFHDFKEEIKKDFTIISNISKSTLNEASDILSLDDRSVALCVRRYQEVEKFVDLKVTDKDYYLRAMEKISKMVKDPVFICFSQDVDWVRDNLCSEFDVRFSLPKDSKTGAIEDLYLMKKCKNFIISNSTFYWWGAWLADNENKIVFSPNNWVNSYSPNPEWNILK